MREGKGAGGENINKNSYKGLMWSVLCDRNEGVPVLFLIRWRRCLMSSLTAMNVRSKRRRMRNTAERRGILGDICEVHASGSLKLRGICDEDFGGRLRIIYGGWG